MTNELSVSGGQRPTWARRIREERDARGWSQSDTIRALRAHSKDSLPSDATLLRNWKRWEAGDAVPDTFYKPLIAKTFGTVTGALFPAPARQHHERTLLTTTGMDTLEIVSRLRVSDVSPSTLDALAITTERLCSEYAYMPSGQLKTEGHAWLGRMTGLLGQRLTLAQHRELLAQAGWIALLVGCVEYDLGEKSAAEATRRAALSLGQEAEHAGIIGWAYEMQAWYALTQGDYRGVIAASDAGQTAAPSLGVSVQLAAQKAKAWARIGDRRQVEVALDQGRTLLEQQDHPSNIDNHFVVDPAKYDFYVMDCYRLLKEDRLAESYARQVIEAGTEFDGRERSPMRNAEARLTLGVIAARQGDVELAVNYGEGALKGERKSLPSLLMCSRELAIIFRERYSGNSDASGFLDRLQDLSTRNTSQTDHEDR
ncbi:XRE family transcriptional regulator [Frankia sp. Cas4]|uniref:XRE family transcriptional regulator n=1 Tax=Frankia sp. Cas4 TaxID=3073927 RepID=UPI002AD49788|nr:XRE family transcriptional regulator [Frankia sp. Cas4]